MPVYLLSEDSYWFPPVSEAEPDGLLAVGGDLSPIRLFQAYLSGIFPWFRDERYIYWFSPDPRLVLFPCELKVSKSMRPYFNNNKFRVTFDHDFDSVIRSCATEPRKEEHASWIDSDFIQAYSELHRMGIAHSVEVWLQDELVGGLYGLALGQVFCGESMFSKASNASKFGFITLVKKLEQEGYRLIDCQQDTSHLRSLGARTLPRQDYMRELKEATQGDITPESWADWKA